MTDVLVVGRIYSDLIFTGVHAPAPGAEVLADGFSISPGGAANRAVAAARLGADTALLSEFGDDPIGAIVQHSLRGEPGLDLTATTTRPDHQISISVAITDGHDRAFVTYQADGDLPEWPADRPCRVAHLGLAGDLPDWAVDLRRNGTTLVGGVGWDASGEWSQRLLDRLGDVDVVIVNDVEALGYTRAETVDDALDILARYVGIAIVTLGRAGAIAAQGSTRVQVPALVVHAVDPTGAGDSFAAGFMAATAWGWDLEQRLRLAAAGAACTVRSAGGAASAPRPEDIATLLDQCHADEGWAFIRRWTRRHHSAVTEGVLSS